jgi:hypothetical protein
MPPNDKICRECKQSKPIREYPTAHHKICTACRTAHAVRYLPPLIQIPTQKYAQLAPPATQEAIRATFNKYQRERMRDRRRQEREAVIRDRIARGVIDRPPAPRLYLRDRVCAHCHALLPYWAYPVPGARICITCNGGG